MKKFKLQFTDLKLGEGYIAEDYGPELLPARNVIKTRTEEEANAYIRSLFKFRKKKQDDDDAI